MLRSFLTIGTYIRRIFPAVKGELEHWKAYAEQIPNLALRMQALASIRTKTFHALGGAIYALYPRVVDPHPVIRFVTALQTISDYLDNLCDRLGVLDETAFLQLHLAMADAVDPSRELHDYYRFYPYQDDGGYLTALVKTCRETIRHQPGAKLVIPRISHYVQLYSHLQAYKHLAIEIREKKLQQWAEQNIFAHSGIYWQEYAAATGSTLGMFYLFAMASEAMLDMKEIQVIEEVYFPWITGLHILLDYWIDAAEDIETGDLNFTMYYDSSDQCLHRIQFFVKQAYQQSARLPYPQFHRMIVSGLLAMYLSDPKAMDLANRKKTVALLQCGSREAWLYHRWCLGLRRAGIL
ncbi:MAG TPA: tetraprenyl-beta-curcumene synthase family protein [Bacillota bacterium]|nr:tetraprenyl-beta-curcumene synthase family protein [Bacillota bacterium]